MRSRRTSSIDMGERSRLGWMLSHMALPTRKGDALTPPLSGTSINSVGAGKMGPTGAVLKGFSLIRQLDTSMRQSLSSLASMAFVPCKFWPALISTDASLWAGHWVVLLEGDRAAFAKRLSSLEHDPKAYEYVKAHGLRYPVQIHARFSLKLTAHLYQKEIGPGASMKTMSRFVEYGLEVVDCHYRAAGLRFPLRSLPAPIPGDARTRRALLPPTLDVVTALRQLANQLEAAEAGRTT